MYMKRIIITLICVLFTCIFSGSTSSAQTVKINAANFPDAAVREALEDWNVEEDEDGNYTKNEYIDTEEVESLFVEDTVYNIKGLDKLNKLETLGMEHYAGGNLTLNNPMLRYLTVRNCEVTSIKITAPYVTDLSVSCLSQTKNVTFCCKSMSSLWLDGENISDIAWGEVSHLTYLNINVNQRHLDLRKLNNLEQIDLSNNKKVRTVDLSKNKKLKKFWANNTVLQKLDTRNNPKLTSLVCYSSKISSLNLTKNTQLKEITVTDAKLNKIDVSKNKKLGTLIIYGNNIKKLNIENNKNLFCLKCGGNRLSTLNVKNNKRLVDLSCSNNKIKSVNVTQNKKLISLDVSRNPVRSLNLQQNKKLEYLSLGNTKVNALDISKNKKLRDLDISYTRIKKLNLKEYKYLEELDISGSKLEKLTLPKRYVNIQLAGKKGKTINIAKYIGKGYSVDYISNDVLKYNKKKGNVKLIGKRGSYGYLTLTKGKRCYEISIKIK